MLINLELFKGKLKRYNERIQECKIEYPDMAEEFKEVSSIEDEFYPYYKWLREDFSDCVIVQEDYRKHEGFLGPIAFKGVYVCHLNSNHTIELLTEYRESRNYDSPIYWSNYGVADNASQVLDYYDELYKKHEEYMQDKDFVILMTPIFRKSEPESGGWRWHKWGRYIGKFEPKCEYIYDEEGIDFVYCFKIVEVEKC